MGWCNVSFVTRKGCVANRGNHMSVASHIAELKKKHNKLSEQIEQLARSPGSNNLEIVRMKKVKLAIRDKIARLSSVGSRKPQAVAA